MKSSDFHCKKHILARIHVVYALLCEDRFGGLTSRGEPEQKSQKVTRGSHRNDVSPLTQGLVALPRSLWKPSMYVLLRCKDVSMIVCGVFMHLPSVYSR